MACPVGTRYTKAIQKKKNWAEYDEEDQGEIVILINMQNVKLKATTT